MPSVFSPQIGEKAAKGKNKSYFSFFLYFIFFFQKKKLPHYFS